MCISSRLCRVYHQAFGLHINALRSNDIARVQMITRYARIIARKLALYCASRKFISMLVGTTIGRQRKRSLDSFLARDDVNLRVKSNHEVARSGISDGISSTAGCISSHEVCISSMCCIVYHQPKVALYCASRKFISMLVGNALAVKLAIYNSSLCSFRYLWHRRLHAF